MFRAASCVISLLLSAVAFNASAGETIYNFATTVQGARNYDGAIFEVGASVGLSPSTRLNPGVRHLERTFNGGTNIGESTAVLGLTHDFGSGFYIANEVSATPDAIIAPEWAFNTQPHYAFGKNDFGLNIGYSRFTNLKAGQIGASYYRSLSRDFSAMFATAFARSDRWLVASHAHLIYKPTMRIESRLVVANGETLESAGLAARFTSLTIETMFGVSQRVRAGLGISHYESTLRLENSALLKLEVR